MNSLQTFSLFLLFTLSVAQAPNDNLCFTGTAQSPVDIPKNVSRAARKNGPDIALTNGAVSFSKNQFDFQLDCNSPAGCGTTTFGGKQYKFLQVHFHSPSEHTVNGVQYPLEAHFVHKSADGALAVVAVLFRLGRPNRFIETLFNQLDSGMTNVNLNYNDFVKRRLGYCVYGGSLTTPPCTEGVTFFVQNRFRAASKKQVEQFARVAGIVQGENSRSVQDLNGRQVMCYTETTVV